MATRYLRIAFNVNGGHVQNESSSGAAASNFYHSAGLTSYTSYTASTSYKYFKGTTGAVTGCATSGGTYATHYQRIASTNSYPNLVNVATFNIVRGGYHIVGTSAYRTTATGGTVLNQDYSSSSTTNPATYAKLGGSTSANKTVTIYVNWTPNEYSVAFNANGGTGTMSTETGFKYGTAKALTSNSFTRTGYTFSGWSTTPNGNGTWESLWSSSSADGYTTLETSLRVHYNTLYLYYDSAWHSFNLTAKSVSSTSAPATWINGSASYSSCSPAPTNAPIGAISYISCIGQTYCLTKTNTSSGNATLYLYRWNPGQSFTNGASVTTLESCPYSDETVTLYAVWTPNTYTMHLFTNDGTPTLSGHTSRYAAHDISITTGTSTYSNIGTCSKTGYTFDGWYDIWDRQIWDSNGNYVYSTSTGVWTSGGVFTGDVLAYNYAPFDWTIWAKFTPNTTTLTLNPNGGTLNGSTASTAKTMTYDNTTNMFLGKPTRTGYTFNGWYYGSTQVTDSYGYFIEDTSYWGTSERIAYYSLSNNNTTINGSGNPYNVLITTVDTYIKGLITNNSTIPYIRVSYSDNGAWSVPGGEKNIFWFTIDEFGHKTDWLYAQAYANGYVRIDFDDNIQYFRLHNSLKKPGWKSTSTALTFTANWTPNTYSVYYYANGGTGTMASSSYTYDAGQTLSLNSFVRPGYKFIGWSNGQNRTRVFYVSDVGPYDPDKMGTDGTYIYLKNGTTYYRVTVDGTNNYTYLGTTAPSGVTVWYSQDERMVFNNKDYWFYHTYSEGSGIDKTYIYATVDNPTIAFTDGEVITTHGNLNLYAVWEPVVYIKQNDIWRICIPQVKASGTWKTPNHAYVKVNGTWKPIY